MNSSACSIDMHTVERSASLTKQLRIMSASFTNNKLVMLCNWLSHMCAV